MKPICISTSSMSNEKYNVLYNLLDSLGCDPFVSWLSPETIDMIMRDLGSHFKASPNFEMREFNEALIDYEKVVADRYKQPIVGEDDYLIDFEY